MKPLRAATALLALFSAGAGPAPFTEPALKQLYDQHRWFDLRDAAQRASVSSLYRGAIASAFNDVRAAERLLNQAIHETQDPRDAITAREALGLMYVRLLRLREALAQFDLIISAAPDRVDVQNFRAMSASFTAHGPYAVVSRRSASFPCAVGPKGLFIPISVNGKSVTWSLDTGANASALTEAEARTLGLTIEHGGNIRDMAGTLVSARTAVAGSIVIGATEFHNVPLLVLPDSAPLLGSEPAGRRGAIGLPIAIGLRTFRWTRDGTCEAGAPSAVATVGPPNLAFDGLKAVTRVGFQTQQLDFVLDTGNQSATQLWVPFARDFAALLKREAQTARKGLSEVGGSKEYVVAVLPEMRVMVGGFPAVVRPANVFPRPVGDSLHYGNVGMEVLSQARGVVFDFQRMSLTAR